MEKECCCDTTVISEIDLSKYCYRQYGGILLDHAPCWLYYWNTGCAKHLDEHKACIGNYQITENKVIINGYNKLLTCIFENYQPAPILKENRKNKRYLYLLLKFLLEKGGKICAACMYQHEAVTNAVRLIQHLCSPQKFLVLVNLGTPISCDFVTKYCKEKSLQSLVTISKTNNKVIDNYTLKMIKFMEILYEIFPYEILNLITSCFSIYGFSQILSNDDD